MLDVGCFDGGFLKPYLGVHDCLGIEIHPEAGQRASRLGIELIGKDFSSIKGSFDVITAFDVLEHVEQPRRFVENCLNACAPGGGVIISTGNLDAWSFRFMGSRYWYCTIAEHISFVSPVWFSRIQEEIEFDIARESFFAHESVAWAKRLEEVVGNLLYKSFPWGVKTLRKLGAGGKNVLAHPELAEHPPYWGSACDHFMVLLVKR